MNTRLLISGAIIASVAVTAPVFANDLSANASVTNNYIWRGLTQTTNDAAVQGGIDFATDAGFYAGTWVSNVKYAPDDAFSYENDLYAGWSGDAGPVSLDFGYLYYNYDKEAKFDFGEIYASLGFAGFGLSAYVLANTEADESPGQDFGFGSTYYLSADYGFEVLGGLEVGLHVGYHDGDFSEAFNTVTKGYTDYNISISRGGFGFMISDTNAKGPAAEGGLDSDEMKFVISYTVDFDLLND